LIPKEATNKERDKRENASFGEGTTVGAKTRKFTKFGQGVKQNSEPSS